MTTEKKREPIYTFDVEIGKDESKQTQRIQIKKPTRSMYADADMFYSIQINKYVKMGLLTAEQVAKKQIDSGGSFTEEQQRSYAKLQSLAVEKEESILRLMRKDTMELTEDERERKSRLYEDLVILRTQIADFEYARNSIYDHTANSKARNDVILWWTLNLAQKGQVKVDSEIVEFQPMFIGETHESKKLFLDELEDNEDELLAKSFDKIVKVITFWYWMGVTEPEKLKELMDQSEEVPATPKEKTEEKKNTPKIRKPKAEAKAEADV